MTDMSDAIVDRPFAHLTSAIVALDFAAQSCSAALASVGPTHPTDSPLHVVLADLRSLLALVDNLSTKLALALKPASPAYAASIPLLDHLAQHTAALAHCTRLLHADTHGATLARDVTDRVKNIIDALRALIQTFLDNAAPEEYLLRTSILHDLITNATGPSGIPNDNQVAVHRAWKSDRDTLEDALQEVAHMIEEAEDQDGAHHDVDDGWDEIGLGDPTSMTKDELARSKNVHQILRLTALLHKRIHLDILAHPSSAPPSAFDGLLAQSTLLLSVSDDLAAALYSPQDPQCVHTEIAKLADVATSLQTQLAVFLSPTHDLTEQMHDLSVHDGSAPPTKKRADRKWFDTCVRQIVRSCANASESSTHTGGTS